MYILNQLTQAQWWMVAFAIIFATIILLFIIFTLFSKKTKPQHVNIDKNFIEKFFIGIGGKENIIESSIDNGRLKFKVANLKLLQSEVLKEIAQSGVFITGNNVKLLFKYDAQDVLKCINNF